MNGALPPRIGRTVWAVAASLILSDEPIVVQHTRLGSRQSALALLSTVASSQD